MGLSFEGLQQSFNSPIATDVGPSLAVYNGQLYAAWKGSSGNERLWYSSTADGANWAPQQSMPDPIATSFRPSLAVLNEVPSLLPGDGGGSPGQLYAAWMGSNGDERLWYSSTADGANWATQQLIWDRNIQFLSSVGPSLAAYNGQLYAAWKGSSGDERLWYSSTADGANWTPQFQLPSPIATSVGPSLAEFKGRLYIAWKGSSSDTRIWWTSATTE